MRIWINAGLACLLGVVFVALLKVPGLGDDTVNLVSNLGQLTAVTTASALCWAASRRDGRHPGAWRLLSVGVGGWAAGQVVWTWYETTGDAVPFPSVADIGFLAFPVASGVGLLLWLGSQSTLAARTRDVLDGVIIALSLLLLSWVTSLGSIVADGTSDISSTALSAAYPIGDVILGTLVLLAVARGWRARADRDVLVVLGLGLGALAMADSAYVYLVSIGSYSSADVVSSGWVFGFLLVGVAALGQHRSTGARTPAGEDSRQQSMAAAALPYVPVAAAGLAVSYDLVMTPERSVIDVLLGGTLVIFVLARQFLAMAENQRLYRELGRTHRLLEHQALHDPLTGLPNRGLFNDRLDRAVQQPAAELALLFCDLDDFKQVNDRYGHDVGDLLLIDVADRLLHCVRRDDTVARLGGDEFAILLHNPNDAEHIAERVVEQMRQPFSLAGHTLEMSMSVGVTQHWATPREVSGPRQRAEDGPTLPVLLPSPLHELGAEPGAMGDWLLRSADQAMYVAKHSGKAQAVLGSTSRAARPLGHGVAVSPAGTAAS